ncbi:uncharacterized protein FA14DRAFT_76709 [Meira miltonrushii]|uniref:Zn(2)-C6 fungal-type domain-containing protein n=1 Tax=Meira miltonrushii TaxID=1280837 RepID=A0A316V912_9BASI|nr:uncharacterized protein FA14DRAFT_76709 [Meira miltonrushii]PWN32673.1 hypothetical protein FA14DRAFT_76709 [Meira miltonrushii]
MPGNAGPSNWNVDSSNVDKRVKQKRNRKAMSCTQCQLRKIKCDRNVPGCNSCVIRGIADLCKWGDERDEEYAGSSYPKKAEQAKLENGYDDQHSSDDHQKDTSQSNGKRTDKRKHKKNHKRQSNDDVGLIVETVLKKLKRKRRKSSSVTESDIDSISDVESEYEEKKPRTSSTRRNRPRRSGSLSPRDDRTPSMRALGDLRELLHYDLHPPPNSIARKLNMTAFEGFMKDWNPFFPAPFERETRVHVKCLAVSLTRLPSRQVTERLIKMYMEEMEPIRGIFNRTLWDRQMSEFWNDLDGLGLSTGEFPSQAITCLLNKPMSDFYVSSKANATDKDYAICSVPNQSMIALVFTLVEQSARFCKLEELISMGCVPRGATEEDVAKGCQLLADAAKFHSNLSESLSLPTLWSVQYLMLNDFISSTMVNPTRSVFQDSRTGIAVYGQRANSAIYSAVNLGLNRLGSGYDDAYKLISEKKSREVMDNEQIESDAEDLIVPSLNADISQSDKKIINTTMRFGSWMTEFDVDISYRELGRKLWTTLVTMDCFISNHLNQYHTIHRGIDHTAPPAPVDDQDLLSPHAADLILQSNPSSSIPKQNTVVSFSLAFARLSRVKVELENEKGAPLPYTDILDLDDQFHALFDRLPGYLQIPALSEDGRDAVSAMRLRSTQMSDIRPGSTQSEERFYTLQRSVLNDQAYFRLLHAHRSYLGKGIKDPRFRRSTLACLEAAYGIYEARIDLEKANSLLQMATFLQSHLVHSALTFQLVLLHEMERWKIAKEEHEKKSNTTQFIYEYDLADIDETLEKLNTCLGLLRNRAESIKKLQEFMPGLESFLKGAKVRRAAQLREIQLREGQRRGPNKRNGKGASVDEIATEDGGRQPYMQSTLQQSQKDPWYKSVLPSMSPGKFNTGWAGTLDQYRGDNRPLPTSGTEINQSLFSTDNPWPTPLYISRENTSVDRSTLPTSHNQTSVSSGSMIEASPSDGTTPSLDMYDPSLWSLESLFPNYYDAGFDLMAALEQELMNGGTTTAEQAVNRPNGGQTYPNFAFTPSQSS